MTTKDMTSGQQKAYRVLLNLYEANAERVHKTLDERIDLEQERKELDELWRMAGLGEPPTFKTSRPVLEVAS